MAPVELQQLAGTASEGLLRRAAHDSLQQQLRSVEGRQRLLSNGVQTKMKELQRELIPIEFMFERGLYSMCEDQGMDVMVKAFQKFVNMFCEQAMSAWREYTAKHAERESREAACCIQRCIRRFLAAVRIWYLVEGAKQREGMRLLQVR